MEKEALTIFFYRHVTDALKDVFHQAHLWRHLGMFLKVKTTNRLTTRTTFHRIKPSLFDNSREQIIGKQQTDLFENGLVSILVTFTYK